MVFTAREADFAASSGDPGRALCAAFCVKEALFKALGRPLDMWECEVFARPGDWRPVVELRGELAVDLGGAVLDVRLFEGDGETVAAVMVMGGASPAGEKT